MTADLISQALDALRQKDFVAARACMTTYAAANKMELQHYLIKGLSELALKDWREAAQTFETALAHFPHQPHLWLNLGSALENCGELDRAGEAYEQCLELKPNTAEACGNLSTIYRRQNRLEKAEMMARRAYELGAPKAHALNALGLAVARQGKYESATKIFNEAQQLAPDDPDILCNLANLTVDQLKFNEAWPLFAAARSINDSATIRHHEGLARLLAGDYEHGWALAEARLELPTALRTRPPCPRWNGDPLQKKTILLIAEQGYGDTIQFCRYGKYIADMGAALIWVVRQPLQRLLAANVSGRVITEDESLPAADYWLPLMSLPLALNKLRPEESPPSPYFTVPTNATPYKLPKTRRRIGIVWTGSPTHERDHERSIALDELQPLFDKIPAHYFAPALAVEEKHRPAPKLFMPINPTLKDFADTASLLSSLDILITVDTAAAHLAGALGVPTFLLLPYCPDWRWGTTGTMTPWYSSVTLLRQPQIGDWISVIDSLATRLLNEPIHSRSDGHMP